MTQNVRSKRTTWKMAVARNPNKKKLMRNLKTFSRRNRGRGKDTERDNALMFANVSLNKVPRLPFKDHYYTKLTWTKQFAALATTSASDVCSAYLLNLNNINRLYDNGASSGHMPYGYLYLSYLYKWCEVIGIKYEITFQDPSGDGMCVGLQVMGDGPPAGQALQTVRERPRTVSDFVSNTGAQVKVFTGYITPWKALGLNKTQYLSNIDQFAIPFDSATQLAASRIVYMQMFASNANRYVSAPSIQISVKLELHVHAFQLKTLPTYDL